MKFKSILRILSFWKLYTAVEFYQEDIPKWVELQLYIILLVKILLADNLY